MGEQAARRTEQRFAVVGKGDPPRRPLEQRPPQVGLQPHDLLADRRLSQVEVVRSAAKAAMVGNADEGPEQLEVEHRFDRPFRSIIL